MKPPENLRTLLVGMLLGAGILYVLETGLSAGDGIPAFGPRSLSLGLPLGLMAEVNTDLEEGDYEFFANRRSIWVVNRSNGRMANYHFRDDEVGSVDRSRVHTINLETFPRKDTYITLSDRNLNNVLWVCNARTGDVQMWYPARDGSLRAEMPVATSADLMERSASSTSSSP
jgi:hypothetical protein